MGQKTLLWIGIVLLFIVISTISALSNNKAADISNILPPSDTVEETQIKVYGNKIILEIPNAQWASYTNTKSMSPVLDIGANGIEIVPESEDELHIGDIVAYEKKWGNIPVIHRIIDIKEDSLGTYYVLKGDNNETIDPVMVRFEQIKYKLIAIIY